MLFLTKFKGDDYMNKKIFSTEYIARKFAKRVNGTVRMSLLPGYMYAETIWIVEWN